MLAAVVAPGDGSSKWLGFNAGNRVEQTGVLTLWTLGPEAGQGVLRHARLKCLTKNDGQSRELPHHKAFTC